MNDSGTPIFCASRSVFVRASRMSDAANPVNSLFVLMFALLISLFRSDDGIASHVTTCIMR